MPNLKLNYYHLTTNKKNNIDNRIGGKWNSFSLLLDYPTSRTIIRAVRHTAVPYLRCYLR